MLTTLDVEYSEDMVIDTPVPIVTKGGKGTRSNKSKNSKVSTSKVQLDVSVAPTRKSTRLNTSELPAKKVCISMPLQEEQPDLLFHRLAANFVAIAHICEEIAETVHQV
jgi:hypothetical protein